MMKQEAGEHEEATLNEESLSDNPFSSWTDQLEEGKTGKVRGLPPSQHHTHY